MGNKVSKTANKELPKTEYKGKEGTILFASDLLSKPYEETVLRLFDYILSNPSCDLKNINLIQAINTDNTISTPYKREISLLSRYLQSINNIPYGIALEIAEYSIDLEWKQICNHLQHHKLKDLTIMTMIRIPSNAGNSRIGVILGTYPNHPNINVEVHSNGRTRFYWNKGEIDLKGNHNLVDGKKHIIGFVRDCNKETISIYLDGKLEVDIHSVGTDVNIPKYGLLFGRDYRYEALAFKGDILRLSVCSEAMDKNMITNITNKWNMDQYIIEKQKHFEMSMRINTNITLNSFTVITLIRISTDCDDSSRIGVILGNYPRALCCNFEVHTKGRTRIYWNNGEIDIYGKLNLIDNEQHCIIFMRDAESKKMSIYVDGELDVTTNEIGQNVNFTAGSTFKIGRDYRGQTMAFKGDILRINAYSTAFNQREIAKISSCWI